MRTSIRMAAIAACVMAISGNAAAHNHHHDEVRHAAAHVHGQGELNFALEDSELHLELMIPAHDILGFESISTDAQQKQLDKALKQLESDQMWALPAGAQCRLMSSHAHTSNSDHGHDHHDHEHEAHMDIESTYVFTCEAPAKLNEFSTRLFEHFTRSEKLHVQGFTSSGQLSEIITPRQPQVRF